MFLGWALQIAGGGLSTRGDCWDGIEHALCLIRQSPSTNTQHLSNHLNNHDFVLKASIQFVIYSIMSLNVNSLISLGL